MEKTIAILGGTGVAGSSITRYCADATKAKVVAISRRGCVEPDLMRRVPGVACDLLDAEAVRTTIAEIEPSILCYAAHIHPHAHQKQRSVVEHMSGRLVQRWAPRMKPVTRFCSGVPGIRGLFYRTLADAAGLHDPNRFNARTFRNVIEAATGAPKPVEHIAVITGGRAYGVHLGPYFFPQWRLPLAEDSPRAPGPNWYFEIEDLLRTARRTSSWTYSIHRPHFILGIAESSPFSLVNAVALYATLLRARGLPLIFPGGPLMYRARLEAVDAELIGEQMLWAAGDARLADQDYNITNGKAFRWSEIWPDIAAYFGMEYEVVPTAKQVEEVLGDVTETWANLCQAHDLTQQDLARVFPANFLNQSMMGFWDVEYDLNKARTAGFTTTRDHFETFQRLFDRMVSRRYIPSPKG